MSADLIKQIGLQNKGVGRINSTDPFIGVGMAISGVLFNLENPSPDQVYLADIIFGQCRIPRYNGATLTRDIWSVSNHILVADMVYVLMCKKYNVPIDPNFRAVIYFHDAGEIYTGDMLTPIKMFLRKENGYAAFLSVSDAIDNAIGIRFDLKHYRHEDVKFIDNIAYEIERRWHRPVYPGVSHEENRLVEELIAEPEMDKLRNPESQELKWEKMRDLAINIGTPKLYESALELVNPYNTEAIENNLLETMNY